MGLFRRRAVLTEDPQDADARDYALDQGAPRVIAECHAEDIAAKYAAGAFGRQGADYAAEWRTWSARNLAACRCGSPWALFVRCVSTWECKDCGFHWEAEVR